MRLVVVGNARIPSEKAHPLQIMQMAGAFAETVGDVRLVYARRDNTDAMRVVRDPFDYFGVARADWPAWWHELPYIPLEIPEGATGG